MAPPFPTVAQQGQGAVSADQLNTYPQVVQNFAQLRTFVPLNDMVALVLGGAAEGDGDQGLFWYSSTSTVADNGSTVIVPTGNAQGAWLLLPPGSNSPGNFASLSVSGNATIGGNLSVGGALTVAGVATFDADVLMVGTGEVQVPVGTTAQRSGAPVPGMIRYNVTLAQYEGYGASWQPLAGTGVAQSPNGRLTLTSGVPVLSSAVIGAIGIIYTPYNGATVPQWNGSVWSSTTFAEIVQALSDTTNSPAAAVAGSVYDLFVWFKAGAATLSRGPAWTNSTTRSLALSRVGGFLVNSLLITNGPQAGYGLYVGTIATDAGGATVTFNPAPAAASGGPTNGAWVGLWNEFWRRPVISTIQDSKASWSYNSSTWRSADNSTNNRITFVAGQAEDGIFVNYQVEANGGSVNPVAIGIALDSTTAPVISSQAQEGVGQFPMMSVSLPLIPLLGSHYLQAMEAAVGANGGFIGSTQFSPAGYIMQLSAQMTY